MSLGMGVGPCILCKQQLTIQSWIELLLTKLAEWRSCGVVLGWQGQQAALSSHGSVEGGGQSSKNCLSSRLRCEQLPSDHEMYGMRGRVVCHQHSSD